MYKLPILFDNIIKLLKIITDGPDTESYYDSLDEKRKNDFIYFIDNFQREISELQECKDSERFYSNYESLYDLIKSFELEFLDYPNFRSIEIKLIVFISQRIVELEEDFSNREIPDSVFLLKEVNIQEINSNYFFSNSIPSKVLLLLNLAELEGLRKFLSETNFNSDFLYQFLHLIGGEEILDDKSYLFTFKDNFDDLKDLYAILKIHLISEGGKLHNPYEYDDKPINNYLEKITIGNNYQQFWDIISIMSEYNCHPDILDKYLRIYHILENFMFRLPLVNLEAISNGRVFRIRDFRLMYERIEKSEQSALANLIEESLKLKDKNGALMKKCLLQKWENLKKLPEFDITEINTFLKNIRIRIGKNQNIAQYNNINFQNFESFLKQLIYYTRNAIVHNKETEFHITHNVLSSNNIIVFSKFLLPSIEELIFNLISMKNNLVWYDNSKLILWDE